MKSIKIMAAAIALCGMTACGDNTPKTFTGFITDASMNTITVENAEGTFTFSTMDADKSESQRPAARRPGRRGLQRQAGGRRRSR